MDGRGPRTRAAWWLLPLPPLLAAVAAFAALAWTSDGFTAGDGIDAFVIGTVAWNVGPGLALTAVGVLVVQGSSTRRSRIASLVGGLLLLAFVGLAMAGVVWSESSTAALGFLFLPLVAWSIALATFAAVLLLDGRRAQPPSDQP